MQIDGILIRAAIAQKGMKCWQIAKQLNMSDSYLSYLLTGRRKASAIFLSRLGKFLNADPRSLLLDSGRRPVNKRQQDDHVANPVPAQGGTKKPSCLLKKRGHK